MNYTIIEIAIWTQTFGYSISMGRALDTSAYNAARAVMLFRGEHRVIALEESRAMLAEIRGPKVSRQPTASGTDGELLRHQYEPCCPGCGRAMLSARARAENALHLSTPPRCQSCALCVVPDEREIARRLEAYFAAMSRANDREPKPGDGVYSGAAAFRHASELVGRLARGEKIEGLGDARHFPPA